MWLLFGPLAIIFAVFNVIWTLKHKEAKWFRYFSLSFTILTLCAEYNQVSQWVVKEDWSALLDVIPYTSDGICGLAIASILINSVQDRLDHLEFLPQVMSRKKQIIPSLSALWG